MIAAKVRSVQEVNEHVSRVTLENNACFDAVRQVFSVTPSDRVTMMSSGEDVDANDFDYAMRGVVYQKLNSFSFVSCGGLLVKTNDASLALGAKVGVYIRKDQPRKCSRLV